MPVRTRFVRVVLGVLIIGLAYYVITRVVLSVVFHHWFDRTPELLEPRRQAAEPYPSLHATASPSDSHLAHQ
jgi:hypothetical protein